MFITALPWHLEWTEQHVTSASAEASESQTLMLMYLRMFLHPSEIVPATQGSLEPTLPA
jgi:hypothetical protein